MMLEACVGKFVGESSVLGKLRIAAEFAGIRLSACVVVECLKRIITITIVLVTIIIIFVVAICIRDSPGPEPEPGPLPALGTLERGKRAKMSG